MHKNQLIYVPLFCVLILFGIGCRSTQGIPIKSIPNTVERNEAERKSLPKDANIRPAVRDEYGYKKGDSFLNKYRIDPSVRQLILVAQSDTKVSDARLFLITKNAVGDWEEKLNCQAFLGKNGIDKTKEGDMRTPTGDFGMIMAFGAKDNPGSLVPYTKLTNTMYLCGDKEYYNQFIDVSKVSHICSGNSEHLLSYIPQYNYALFFDYNKENVYGKGSGIFLHCFGKNPFTLGCIAVAEKNMVEVLKTVDKNARICIYSNK